MKKINLILITILFLAILFSCATAPVQKDEPADKNDVKIVKMEEDKTSTEIKEEVKSEPTKEEDEVVPSKDDSKLDSENSTKEVENNENTIVETTEKKVIVEDTATEPEIEENKSEDATEETIIEPTTTETNSNVEEITEENVEEVAEEAKEEQIIEPTDDAIESETLVESPDVKKVKPEEVKIHKATAKNTINAPTSLTSIWATLILASLSVIVAYALRNKEGQALKLPKILIILATTLVVTIIVSIFTSAIVLISVISLAPSYYILSRKNN